MNLSFSKYAVVMANFSLITKRNWQLAASEMNIIFTESIKMNKLGTP